MEAYKLLLALKIELLNLRIDPVAMNIINRNIISIEKQLKHLLEHR